MAGLEKLQARLDEINTKLDGTKRDVPTSVAEAENLTESARATWKLGVDGSERSPEHAQRACDIATARQHEGQFALNDCVTLVNLQRDVTANSAESPVLADFTKLLLVLRLAAGGGGQAQSRSP